MSRDAKLNILLFVISMQVGFMVSNFLSDDIRLWVASVGTVILLAVSLVMWFRNKRNSSNKKK